MKTIETLDNRPFRRLITTIGALPTSFIDSMSYYEMLAWFCDFLQNTVIPAVNDNAEALAELQRLFVELKEYVDNYFENLDVQEEINNKLDEMAEAGTLTDIIAQYLTLAGVLAFSTVTDLANAENLSIGSKAKTFGYKRAGDGVYNLYTIREIKNTDVVDGYNIVALANAENLIAERLQYGKKLVINLTEEDNIQDYLDLVGDKTIVLPKEESYTANTTIYINSDTTIDLNGGKLVANYENDEETLIFAYKLDSTFTEYNGYKNICIKNGTIENGCLCFMHNKNVKIENVEFLHTNSRHSMQIAASYNVTIKSCTFNGTLPINTNGSECINIDPCNYGGQPYMDESSVMYDHTANKNIFIADNYFNNPVDEGYRYTTAIGSHGRDDSNQTIAENIVIENNEFGSPYTSAINTCDYIDVTIENNKCSFNPLSIDTTSYFIKMHGKASGINVLNNESSNSNQFIYSNYNDQIDDIKVINNTFSTNDDTSKPCFTLFYVTNSVIKNNIAHYKQTFAILDSHYSGSAIPETACNNIVIADNIIDKTDSTANQAIRIRVANNIYIDNNNFAFFNLSASAGNAISITSGLNQQNIVFTNNKCKFSDALIPADSYQSCLFNKNNEQLKPISNEYDNTNLTVNGSLTTNATFFREIKLQIGASPYSNIVEIKPWFSEGDKFITTTRSWKLPVVKSDGTNGILTFEINNNGGSFSYTGDVALRRIYGLD